MTGGRVWGEVTNNFTSTFTNNVGRGPFMWINWPCTDNSKKHLIMGGYDTFLHPGVEPSKIQGIMLNPMQQSKPSKVAISVMQIMHGIFGRQRKRQTSHGMMHFPL